MGGSGAAAVVAQRRRARGSRDPDYAQSRQRSTVISASDFQQEDTLVSMIFAGMGPYLDASDIWPGIHPSFIVYLRDHLQPRLRPRYLTAIEARVFVEGPLHEPDITILDRRSGQRGVTVIEVVSPTNKYAGPGRESYRARQQKILLIQIYLIEIKFLSLGPHVLAVPEGAARNRGIYDYLVCVNRAVGQRQKYELCFSHLRRRLPRVRIP